MKQIKYQRVPSYTQSDHKPVYGVFKALVSNVIPEKREEVLKLLKEGALSHQKNELFNQNKLLSYLVIARRTLLNNNDDGDVWVVDEEVDKGWGLANIEAQMQQENECENNN